jgi:repressor LexA
MELVYESGSGAAIERRPVRHVPLVGDVAAGTGVLAAENIEETIPVPEDFAGAGQLFMLRVRGDSMVDAGILDGDYVVVRQQPDADAGEIVVAGIPGEEATVKTLLRRRGKIVLRPENPGLDEMIFEPAEVSIYGKVVTLLRRLP